MQSTGGSLILYKLVEKTLIVASCRKVYVLLTAGEGQERRVGGGLVQAVQLRHELAEDSVGRVQLREVEALCFDSVFYRRIFTPP